MINICLEIDVKKNEVSHKRVLSAKSPVFRHSISKKNSNVKAMRPSFRARNVKLDFHC